MQFLTVPVFSSTFSFLCQYVDESVEVGIAGAEAARQEVATTLGYADAVREDFEFSDLAGPLGRVDVQPFLDEGHEPRDLYGVVGSSRAMNNFDFHHVLGAALRIFYVWHGAFISRLC